MDFPMSSPGDTPKKRLPEESRRLRRTGVAVAGGGRGEKRCGITSMDRENPQESHGFGQ